MTCSDYASNYYANVSYADYYAPFCSNAFMTLCVLLSVYLVFRTLRSIVSCAVDVRRLFSKSLALCLLVSVTAADYRRYDRNPVVDSNVSAFSVSSSGSPRVYPDVESVVAAVANFTLPWTSLAGKVAHEEDYGLFVSGRLSKRYLYFGNKPTRSISFWDVYVGCNNPECGYDLDHERYDVVTGTDDHPYLQFPGNLQIAPEGRPVGKVSCLAVRAGRFYVTYVAAPYHFFELAVESELLLKVWVLDPQPHSGPYEVVYAKLSTAPVCTRTEPDYIVAVALRPCWFGGTLLSYCPLSLSGHPLSVSWRNYWHVSYNTYLGALDTPYTPARTPTVVLHGTGNSSYDFSDLRLFKSFARPGLLSLTHYTYFSVFTASHSSFPVRTYDEWIANMTSCQHHCELFVYAAPALGRVGLSSLGAAYPQPVNIPVRVECSFFDILCHLGVSAPHFWRTLISALLLCFPLYPFYFWFLFGLVMGLAHLFQLLFYPFLSPDSQIKRDMAFVLFGSLPASSYLLRVYRIFEIQRARRKRLSLIVRRFFLVWRYFFPGLLFWISLCLCCVPSAIVHGIRGRKLAYVFPIMVLIGNSYAYDAVSPNKPPSGAVPNSYNYDQVRESLKDTNFDGAVAPALAAISRRSGVDIDCIEQCRHYEYYDFILPIFTGSAGQMSVLGETVEVFVSSAYDECPAVNRRTIAPVKVHSDTVRGHTDEAWKCADLKAHPTSVADWGIDSFCSSQDLNLGWAVDGPLRKPNAYKSVFASLGADKLLFSPSKIKYQLAVDKCPNVATAFRRYDIDVSYVQLSADKNWRAMAVEVSGRCKPVTVVNVAHAGKVYSHVISSAAGEIKVTPDITLRYTNHYAHDDASYAPIFLIPTMDFDNHPMYFDAGDVQSYLSRFTRVAPYYFPHVVPGSAIPPDVVNADGRATVDFDLSYDSFRARLMKAAIHSSTTMRWAMHIADKGKKDMDFSELYSTTCPSYVEDDLSRAALASLPLHTLYDPSLSLTRRRANSGHLSFTLLHFTGIAVNHTSTVRPVDVDAMISSGLMAPWPTVSVMSCGGTHGAYNGIQVCVSADLSSEPKYAYPYEVSFFMIVSSAPERLYVHKNVACLNTTTDLVSPYVHVRRLGHEDYVSLRCSTNGHVTVPIDSSPVLEDVITDVSTDSVLGDVGGLLGSVAHTWLRWVSFLWQHWYIFFLIAIAAVLLYFYFKYRLISGAVPLPLKSS